MIYECVWNSCVYGVRELQSKKKKGFLFLPFKLQTRFHTQINFLSLNRIGRKEIHTERRNKRFYKKHKSYKALIQNSIMTTSSNMEKDLETCKYCRNAIVSYVRIRIHKYLQ